MFTVPGHWTQGLVVYVVVVVVVDVVVVVVNQDLRFKLNGYF